MLRNEVADGWTEISSQPDYVSPDYHAVHLKVREAEVATFTDPPSAGQWKSSGYTL